MNKQILSLVVVLMLLVGVGGVVGTPKDAEKDKTTFNSENADAFNWKDSQYSADAQNYLKTNPAKLGEVPDSRINEIDATTLLGNMQHLKSATISKLDQAHVSALKSNDLSLKVQGKSVISTINPDLIKNIEPTKFAGISGTTLAETHSSGGQTILEQMSAGQTKILKSDQLKGFYDANKNTIPIPLGRFDTEEVNKLWKDVWLNEKKESVFTNFQVSNNDENYQAYLENGKLVLINKNYLSRVTFDPWTLTRTGNELSITQEGDIVLNGKPLKFGGRSATVVAKNDDVLLDPNSKNVKLVITDIKESTQLPGISEPLSELGSLEVAFHTIKGNNLQELVVVTGPNQLRVGATGEGVSLTDQNTGSIMSLAEEQKGKVFVIRKGADRKPVYGYSSVTDSNTNLEGHLTINTITERGTSTGTGVNLVPNQFKADGSGSFAVKVDETTGSPIISASVDQMPNQLTKKKPTAQAGLTALQKAAKDMKGAAQNNGNLVCNAGIFKPVYEPDGVTIAGWNRAGKDGKVANNAKFISKDSMQNLVTGSSLKGQQTTKADPVQQKTDQLAAAKADGKLVDGRKWDGKNYWVDAHQNDKNKLEPKKTADLIADAKPISTPPKTSTKPLVQNQKQDSEVNKVKKQQEKLNKEAKELGISTQITVDGVDDPATQSLKKKVEAAKAKLSSNIINKKQVESNINFQITLQKQSLIEWNKQRDELTLKLKNANDADKKSVFDKIGEELANLDSYIASAKLQLIKFNEDLAKHNRNNIMDMISIGSYN